VQSVNNYTTKHAGAILLVFKNVKSFLFHGLHFSDVCSVTLYFYRLDWQHCVLKIVFEGTVIMNFLLAAVYQEQS
jgi:hypothetical protein